MIGNSFWRADIAPWARSAATAGEHADVGIESTFTGTAENDTLDGTASDDTFDVSQGGRDIVNGLGGDDTFFFGKALTSGDEINGGTGNDTVEIQGDSSVGTNYTVLFKDASLTGVENLVLDGGSGFTSYTIALVDACVAAGATLNITVDSPGVTQDIFIDSDFETDGHVNFTGGAGDDAMIVKNLKAADKLDGGDGSNFLTLHGDYSAGLVMNATTAVNFFEIDFGPGFSYNLTLDNATCAAGEVLQLNAQDLLATQTLTLNATAETDGQLFITGGKGNDTITLGASATPPQVNLSFGGNDTVTGSTAADLFKMGGALTADDHLDGGGTAGTADVVELDGDYSAGITLNATTIVNVETILMKAGHNYKLTINDGNVAAGATLLVDAALLGAANTLTFTGSNEASGILHVVGGLGNDVITTGDGNDLISLDKGGNDTATGGGGNDTFDMLAALTAADALNGGAGDDILQLTGDYSAGVTFLASTITSVETIRVGAGFNYKLTWDDANGAATRTVTIDGTALGTTRFVNFNGAAELDGRFSFLGGAGNDVVVGGALNDTLNGGSGNDSLSGGGGNDIITSGLGVDTANGGAGDDTFQFGINLTASDTIVGDLGTDTLVLDGDYTVVFGASSIASLEVIDLEAGHSYDLTFNNANVAAGTRLTVDGAIDGAHTVSLDGSAELDGNFTFTGGGGDDALIGGALADILTGGGGDDVINGGDGGDTLRGSGGRDTITGGGGADTFVYNNVGESTGPKHDTLIGFDASADRLDLTLAVTGIDAEVTSGKLNSSKFNNSMQHLVRDTDLAANHAVLATPDRGDLAGKVFLIVDINGIAGYQSNADLVIQLDGAANLASLDVSDFI